MKVKVKKLVAVVMLVLLLLNSLPINVFAAFITDINSNAEFGVVSGSLADYKHELHYAIMMAQHIYYSVLNLEKPLQQAEIMSMEMNF